MSLEWSPGARKRDWKTEDQRKNQDCLDHCTKKNQQWFDWSWKSKETCCHLDSSGKTPLRADMKNLICQEKFSEYMDKYNNSNTNNNKEDEEGLLKVIYQELKSVFFSPLRFFMSHPTLLSLRVFGLLSSSLLLFPQRFGRYVRRLLQVFVELGNFHGTSNYVLCWIFVCHFRVQVLSTCIVTRLQSRLNLQPPDDCLLRILGNQRL